MLRAAVYSHAMPSAGGLWRHRRLADHKHTRKCLAESGEKLQQHCHLVHLVIDCVNLDKRLSNQFPRYSNSGQIRTFNNNTWKPA